MKHYTATEIKELNTFNVSGNLHTNVCKLNMFNLDENNIESDSVFIELTQNRLRTLIKMLEAYVKPEEE